MEIHVAPNYEEMSKQASEEVIRLMQASKNKLLCIASGDTPTGLFRDLVARVHKKELSLSDWKFVGLDEWAGMNGSDEGSCRYHLNRQFFQPLHIKEENISFFDGRAIELENECQQTENFIHQHGGIDVAILGLGLNGHIGMNEPGTSPNLHSHIADIDPETQEVGQKYFTTPQTLSHGITLGLANIMETRHVILLVSGARKAGIVKRIIEDEPSEQLPASLLRQHPGLKIYLDAEAAQLIQPKTR
jgi:galactosamine-6-phosphate isomerase